MIARALATLALLSAGPFPATGAQPQPFVRAEIEYLLQSIGTSPCLFFRNGSWYDGPSARAHLRTKYDYLAARNLIATAEDFIDKAATRSSVSGEPYEVRCGNDPEVETRVWLRAVLARHRASMRR